MSETLVTELLRYCKTRYGIDLNRFSGARDLLTAETCLQGASPAAPAGIATAGRAVARTSTWQPAPMLVPAASDKAVLSIPPVRVHSKARTPQS